MIGSLEQSNTFVFIKQMLHPVLLLRKGRWSSFLLDSQIAV